MISASSLGHKIYSPRARFAVLVAFMVIVFLTGGSSRDDMPQLLMLRPLAFLFAGYAGAAINFQQFLRIRGPVFLLAALIAIIALQLIPLPPAVAHALPHRQLIGTIDTAMGMETPWRPPTLSPSKTWNALFSMGVPLAMLLLLGIQEPDSGRKVWVLVVALAMVSTLLGIVQLTGQPGGPAYFYRVTNPDSAVGIFANRNHHGVFLGTILLVCAWLFSTIEPRARSAPLQAAGVCLAVLLVVPTIFLAFSRAGLATAALALLAGLPLLLASPYIARPVTLTRRRTVDGRWLLGLALIAGAVLIALVLISTREVASDRFVEANGTDELRLQLLPIFGQMIRDSFPWGFGFGSWEYVYKIYEPVEMLRPEYVNLAHNDWAQWLIEGGLAGALLILAAAIWYCGAVRDALAEYSRSKRNFRLMAAGVIALLAAASALDYPLRTPTLMIYLTLAGFTLAGSWSHGGRRETPSSRKDN